MTRYHLLPRALQEFEEAVEHYLELSSEAASRFVDEFEAAVSFICDNPKAPQRFEGDLRRWNLQRFPYALIYRIIDARVVIVAVMHMRREPGYWKTRRS